MSEAIHQLVATLVMAYNAHDLDLACACFAPDYEGIDVAQAFPHRGLDGIRETLAKYFMAFPDLQFEEKETVVDGKRVVQVWTARGTHVGTFMNIPPTGRKVLVHGVSVLTLEGRQVRHGYYIWDVAGLLRNIGLLPEL